MDVGSASVPNISIASSVYIQPPTPFIPILRYEKKKSNKKRELLLFENLDEKFFLPAWSLKKSLDKYDIPIEFREDVVDEMSGLSVIKLLNSQILAAAIVLLNYSKRDMEITPTTFKKFIDIVMEPLDYGAGIEPNTQEYNMIKERLKADIYRYIKLIINYRKERRGF
jgi:hypothetical protein